MALPQGVNQEKAVEQFREFLMSYNRVSEMCFNDCVHDFTSRKILNTEQNCVISCMEKYLKFTQRVSLRFQEYQIQQNENALAGKSGPFG